MPKKITIDGLQWIKFGHKYMALSAPYLFEAVWHRELDVIGDEEIVRGVHKWLSVYCRVEVHLPSKIKPSGDFTGGSMSIFLLESGLTLDEISKSAENLKEKAAGLIALIPHAVPELPPEYEEEFNASDE